jgi:transposase
MPWKECSVMDERLQFVARRLAGEAMTELCREFGISRKTGYKIFDRYQECGVQGLTDDRGRDTSCLVRRVGPGNFTPSPSRIRT